MADSAQAPAQQDGREHVAGELGQRDPAEITGVAEEEQHDREHRGLAGRTSQGREARALQAEVDPASIAAYREQNEAVAGQHRTVRLREYGETEECDDQDE